MPAGRVKGHRASTCTVVVVLATAAATAVVLLTGLNLSLQGKMLSGPTGKMQDKVHLHSEQQLHISYAMFSPAAWVQSFWGATCEVAIAGSAALPAAALLAEVGEAPSIPQLCQLPHIWKNCSRGIYLDVGSNIGVQIRKLYNPQQFPNSKVLPVFDHVFGRLRKGVCALGVEANPHHTAYLKQLNAYFQAQGYQALVLTEVAASSRSGSATFYTDAGSPVEWGASLTQGDWQRHSNGSTGATEVQLLDLPAFMMDVVRPILQQELLTTGQAPPVVMKLDVEGEEYTLFPALMLTGGLCQLSMLFLEAHPWWRFGNTTGAVVNMKMSDMQDVFDRLRKANPYCNVEVLPLDDESYLDGDKVPLPTHKADSKPVHG